MALRGGRGDAGDRGAGRLRRALATAELALTVVLVTGAGLLVRSFDRITSTRTGVNEIDRLVTMDVSLPEARYPEPAHAMVYYERLLERVRALPNVESAAAGLTYPLGGMGWGNRLYIDGRVVPEADVPIVAYQIVTPEYMSTAGIAILAGRDLEARPGGNSQSVLVNRTLAERFLPGEEPLGRRVRFSESSQWATIVGVVDDVPLALGEPASPVAYVPPTLESLRSMTLLIRVNGEPAGIAPAVRSVIRELDADVPVTNVVALSVRISETVATRRYTASLVTLFASFALLLSCVGIYGVLAYAVSRRRREMGVRVALGARPADVLRLVLREGVLIAATGIALGLAGALALTGMIASMLYDTQATDPLTLAGVLVAGSALLASWLPARRAAAIDPLRAMEN